MFTTRLKSLLSNSHWVCVTVTYLVLEGLRSQLFVEWCKVSGKTLQMALHFLLLRDTFNSFEAGRKKNHLLLLLFPI